MSCGRLEPPSSFFFCCSAACSGSPRCERAVRLVFILCRSAEPDAAIADSAFAAEKCRVSSSTLNSLVHRSVSLANCSISIIPTLVADAIVSEPTIDCAWCGTAQRTRHVSPQARAQLAPQSVREPMPHARRHVRAHATHGPHTARKPTRLIRSRAHRGGRRVAGMRPDEMRVARVLADACWTASVRRRLQRWRRPARAARAAWRRTLPQ
eukprot:4072304-Prymnesium_polylepis.3